MSKKSAEEDEGRSSRSILGKKPGIAGCFPAMSSNGLRADGGGDLRRKNEGE
jgi:hypothetical protein